MGLSLIYSRGCVGVESPLVTVEVHTSGGLPTMSMVGLPNSAVREAKDRVRAAILNSKSKSKPRSGANSESESDSALNSESETKFTWPASRITIALAPAELPKDGGGFDLPIALGILAASGQIPERKLSKCEFLGEMALNGELRTVRGVVPAAIRARDSGRTLVIPAVNAAEARLVKGGKQFGAATLQEVCNWLRGEIPSRPDQPAAKTEHTPVYMPDLCDVIGLHGAKRALEVAAAGSHNLLMIGPPGTGKTLLASRLPGILPPMSEAEALETAALVSVSQLGLDYRDWGKRPFRTPHHSCSGVALAGGGARPRPGEVSLAHNGVLFLDELPEFGRHALETLREPLESGRIVISRAARHAIFPARFQLVTAMNPCPCGLEGDNSGRCGCSAEQIQRYRNRVSGPLLDRIDLQVEVLRPEKSIISETTDGIETSAEVRERVINARKIQLKRTGTANALMDNNQLNRHCHIDGERLLLLEMAAEQLFLSPRACHRILKVARTIADLDAVDNLTSSHLAEAISFRRLQMGQMSG